MASKPSEIERLTFTNGPVVPTGVRVLVIDDNNDAADTMGAVLGFGGHEVRLCYDGNGALAECRDFLPHIVLLDLGIPQVDGFQIARQLREDPGFTDLTIVALTGYGDEAHRERARAHFNHYLLKPCDLAELEAILAEAKIRLQKKG